VYRNVHAVDATMPGIAHGIRTRGLMNLEIHSLRLKNSASSRPRMNWPMNTPAVQ
jgi:hypothetical protein